MIGGKRSPWSQIHFGVPHGSVLGPLLYVLFTADIPWLISPVDLGVQQYADDTQAYNHCLPVNAPVALRYVVDTLETLGDWMQSNRMKLNPDKTQYIWIGTNFSCQGSTSRIYRRCFRVCSSSSRFEILVSLSISILPCLNTLETSAAHASGSSDSCARYVDR